MGDSGAIAASLLALQGFSMFGSDGWLTKGVRQGYFLVRLQGKALL